jgi:hypothetical protein
MSDDERDILKALRAELDFIERGGDARRPRTPLLSVSVSQDSKTCLNFGYPYRARACGECLLYDFASAEGQAAQIPCHHIPFDAGGATVGMLKAACEQKAIEAKVRAWPSARLKEIAADRSARPIY